MEIFNLNKIEIQKLTNWFTRDKVLVDVLRLDLLHNIVSGNKWFKLKYYIEDAIKLKKDTIVTFGGAYSNHIVASAFASSKLGLKSIGYVRGEEPSDLSHTLLNALSYGMKLNFVSRNEYKKVQKTMQLQSNEYLIQEGGYGQLGANGAATIISSVLGEYDYIIAASGTGTMLSGLCIASTNERIIGINVLKGNADISDNISTLSNQKPFTIINDYHFNGYAKHPNNLINWMNLLFLNEKLPTDIVYTSKLFFGVYDLITKNYFEPGAKIMAIHSGGLQGNLSLTKGTLVF